MEVRVGENESLESVASSPRSVVVSTTRSPV